MDEVGKDNIADQSNDGDSLVKVTGMLKIGFWTMPHM